MNLAMFVTVEEYVAWLNREIELLEKVSLKDAEEMLTEAKATGCSRFLAMNPGITDEHKEEAIASHIKWLEGNVKRVKRQINKHRKSVRKALAEA